MSQFTITDLYVYPIKSCGGVRLASLEVDQAGPLWDREWMLVQSADGKFITQREVPRLALLQTRLEKGVLLVEDDRRRQVEIATADNQDHRQKSVHVWSDNLSAMVEAESICHWFSEFLDRDCLLVRMPPHARRIPEKYGVQGRYMRFADSLPFLLTSEASLQDLNSRLPEPVRMSRFRPNIVIDGGQAYAEDLWLQARIGEIEFSFPRPAPRCTIINVEQETGISTPQTLKTLAQYRRDGNRVLFGQTIIHAQAGRLNIGDKVQVMQNR